MALRISSNSCRLAARWATPATFANSVSNVANTSAGGMGGRAPASVEAGAKAPARDNVWSGGRPKAIRIPRIKSSRRANPNTSRSHSVERASTRKRHIVHQPENLPAVTTARRKLPPQAQNCTITHCSGVICQNLEIHRHWEQRRPLCPGLPTLRSLPRPKREAALRCPKGLTLEVKFVYIIRKFI